MTATGAMVQMLVIFVASVSALHSSHTVDSYIHIVLPQSAGSRFSVRILVYIITMLLINAPIVR